MNVTGAQVERYLVGAAVLATCALFTAEAADPVNIIKLTALMIATLGVVGTVSWSCLRHRVLDLPAGPGSWVLLALLAGVVTAAITAPLGTTALLGAYGRNSGLLAYACALLLFLATRRTVRGDARPLLAAFVLAGLFTSSYGLLQYLGVDAVAWNNPFNPIIAALGNPNFASGYMGIAGAAALGGALWTGWQPGWRIVAGTTAALCGLTAAISSSVQGPVAAVAGLAVVAAAWLMGRAPRQRLVGLSVLGGTSAVGLTVLSTGLIAQIGPAASLFTDAGSRARIHYWSAGLQMFRDDPATGVGLDHYGSFWRVARSPAAAQELGGPSFADAAHSVPIQMLAQGGLVLAVPYAAFVLCVLWFLVRGLRRLDGPRRMLLASFGAAWAAYQVQSSVSIDQVPLIVAHFVLAGAVIALSGGDGLRRLTFRGAVVPEIVQPGRQKRRPARAVPALPRALSHVDLVSMGAAAVAILVAFWFSLVPVRASIEVQNGDEILRAGDGNAALLDYEQAVDLVPGQGIYLTRIGLLFDQVTQPALAQAAYRAAGIADPFEPGPFRRVGALSEAQGDLETAQLAFAHAIRIDPLNPDTLVEAATFELRHGGAAAARKLLERAVVDLPQAARLWATLGDARAVLADDTGARSAYQRALQLDRGSLVATEGLANLAAR